MPQKRITNFWPSKTPSMLPPPSPVNERNIATLTSGLPHAVGHRGTVTSKELPKDVVSSAMQKSIRLGRTKDALRFALEFWMLGHAPARTVKADRTASEAAKRLHTDQGAALTNLRNRLYIIGSEDVGVGSPYLLNKLEIHYDALSHKVARKSVQGLVALLTIVKALADAPHSRLVSSVNNAYVKPESMQWIVQHHPDIQQLSVGPLDSESQRHAAQQQLVQYLQAGSYQAATIVGALHFQEQQLNRSEIPHVTSLLTGHRQFKSGYLAFEVFLELVASEATMHDTVASLMAIYAELNSERHVPLLHAMLIVIFAFRGKFPEGADLHPHVHAYSQTEALTFMQQHLNDALVVDTDFYDMHTAAGRKRGLSKATTEGHTHFVDKGVRLHREISQSKEDKQLFEWYKGFKTQGASSAGIKKRKRDHPPAPRQKKTPATVSNDARLPRFTWEMLQQGLQCSRVRTCGGKPMTFLTTLNNKPVVFKRATGDDGATQILMDHLKPIFGLRQMHASRFVGDFDTTKKHASQDWDCDNIKVVKRPNTVYLLFDRFDGKPLSDDSLKKVWFNSDPLLLQYMTIMLFRYGTFRASDGNTCNIMKSSHSNHLLSIDEMGSNRSNIFKAGKTHYDVLGMRKFGQQLHDLCLKWAALPATRFAAAVQAAGMPPETIHTIAANLRQLPHKFAQEMQAKGVAS